jgi:glutathione synthase
VKLLFLLDPLPKLKQHKDSSIAMMRAAARAGHEVWANDMGFASVGGKVVGQVMRLQISAEASWYEVKEEGNKAFDYFDRIIERKDPPFDMEYVYRTYLLELCATTVYNAPAAIRAHNEKLSILQHPDMIAPTIVTRDAATLKAFVATHEDTIFKPLDGMGGKGIFRVRKEDANLNVIIETLTKLGQETIMAQRYLPDILAGDKRILLIGGEVVPYALARIPAQGETRGNMAAGGRPVAQALSDTDRHIAHTMAKRLLPKGLFLVGLDVIGDKLTEINVTSPTGFVEIEQQSGFKVADLFIQHLCV